MMMKEGQESEGKFMMKEYQEVNVKRDMLQLCSDCYQALGWTIQGTSTGLDSVTLKLQRDRKIKNRVALIDLQRKCEEAWKTIDKLEKSINAKPMGIALGVGMAGTVFMAGSVFAYLAAMLPLSILLAVPGFALWALPYFLYQNLRKACIDKTKPLIDSNYDTIYEACEKAGTL